MANLFESKPCGRCGGSGSYSYCSMYGSTCFKCGGKKEVLTRRGSVAQAFFTSLCSKRSDELVPGDEILDTFDGKWAKVLSIGKSETSTYVDGQPVPMIAIECDSSSIHASAESVHRVRQPAEIRAKKVLEALAFQATLTKIGTVKKGATEPSQ